MNAKITPQSVHITNYNATFPLMYETYVKSRVVDVSNTLRTIKYNKLDDPLAMVIIML